jgi:CheY-like chemotaxis protein
VRDHRPALVLLDIQLPDVDGFTVCEQLVASGPDAPLVVLTSTREASTYRRRLGASGARAFIAKADLTGERLAALSCGRG